MLRHISISVFMTLVMLLAAGCSSQRQLTYFDDIETNESGVMGNLGDYQVKLQPDDELIITVNSINPKASAAYNLPLVNPATASEAGIPNNPTQQSYVVNALGDITFPVLGKIHVAGMTTLQLADYLTERIAENVVDPVVRVDLINFHYHVLGEVGHSGSFRANGERVTLFDAIASAGDLTSYGRRDNILVIRELDGKKVYQRLNLKDSKIVDSPFFYLRQNDVVYVEPNNIRQANSKYNTNNGFKLSVISAIISGVSVITSLVIALTR